MSRRSHKELWEQLKVPTIYGNKKRYTQRELYSLMFNLELGQKAQDPSEEILKVDRRMCSKEEKR